MPHYLEKTQTNYTPQNHIHRHSPYELIKAHSKRQRRDLSPVI